MECEFQVTKSMVKLETAIRWTIKYLQSPEDENFHQVTISTAIPIAKADQVTHLLAVLKVWDLLLTP